MEIPFIENENSRNQSNKKCIEKPSGAATLPIEGSSLFSFSFLKHQNAAMTVEAAIVLPLFLFALLNLLSIIEIYRLHSTLRMSLREVGTTLSVYAYPYDKLVELEEDSGIEALLENVAFSYLYVKAEVEKLAGEDYLDNSPLTNGKDELIYLDSDILQQGDCIDLVVHYRVSPFINLVGFQPKGMFCRYYGRAWTGYDVTGESEGAAEEKVFVTENGTVYHLYKTCSHLNLSISQRAAGEIEHLRSEDGSKYKPCEVCVRDKEAETYYITPSGNRYHQTLSCGSISRSITTIAKTKAEKKYRLCSECGRK